MNNNNKRLLYSSIAILYITSLVLGAVIYAQGEQNTTMLYRIPKIVYLNVNSIDTYTVKQALDNGNIVVISGYVNNINLLNKLPSLKINTTIVDMYFDPEKGTITKIIRETHTYLVKPRYIVLIMYHGPKANISLLYFTHVDSRDAIAKTIDEGQKGLYYLINMIKMNFRNIELDSYTSGSGNWEKKWEDQKTWIINGQDQLYTRYEAYQLDVYDTVTNKEYWRIDGYIDHNLQSYTSTSSECGPYMHQRTIYINAGDELYKYGPPTTPEDTTVSVNIGFSVSTSGGSIGVSYSWSWNNPGVKYDVSAYYPQHNIKWTETFHGPDYTWWPWYSQPTSVAHNSYNSHPSAVFRTTVGSGITINKLESTWTTYHDKDIHLDGLLLVWTRIIVTYSFSWSNIHLNSKF